MLGNRTYQHIANFLLKWIRSDETAERLGSVTQREIRNELRRLVALEDVEGDRIANEFTRWAFSGDPLFGEMRWKEDLWCREKLMRMILRATNKEGAEDDTDISDDVNARSYPRLRNRIQDSTANIVAYMKAKQAIGAPVAEAEAGLVKLLRGAVEDWELSL